MLVFAKCQQQRFDSLRIILESDRETMTKFDFLASLLDFGLGHVVEEVLELLDVEDLLSVQLVSKLWSVEQRKKAKKILFRKII